MPLALTTGTSSRYKNTRSKGKFEIKTFLLLHILIPGVMLSSLETINPWLSACDLKQPATSDLKPPSCSVMPFPTKTAPRSDFELLCPKECPPNESKTNASCLAYLDDARRSAICNFNLGNGIEWLKSFLGTIRLRHCCEYKIIESLSQSLLERVLRGKEECFKIIDSLVDVDNLAARVTCEFSEILSRYDCEQTYSVKFSCNDCLEAYRRWVCSTLVPYFNESTRIRPCRSVCQSVEQKCPYFLPENKAPALPTQYAGEPTFLCMDPNIPETGEQQRRSLYPDKNACCVKICGSLKDGLCVERGSKCKSEDLIAYEEALDQVAECGVGVESTAVRVPSLECTASEPYSSPHKLGSGASSPSPGGPVLVLFLAYLAHRNTQRDRRTRHLIIFLLVNYYYSYAVPLSLNLLACLIVAFANLAPFISSRQISPQSLLRKLIILLPRLKTRVRLIVEKFVFNLIQKRYKLVFNYLKYNSNRWQYFFILISVNLPYQLIVKHAEPLTTLPPHCLFLSDFDISRGELKTRRARHFNNYYNCNYYDYDYFYDDCIYYSYGRYEHYYYYYYYYCYENYNVLILLKLILLLRRIAQNTRNYLMLGTKSIKLRGAQRTSAGSVAILKAEEKAVKSFCELIQISMNKVINGNEGSVIKNSVTIPSDMLTIIITPIPLLLLLKLTLKPVIQLFIILLWIALPLLIPIL